MSNHTLSASNRVKRLAVLLFASIALLILPACGGSNNGTSTTTSNLQHRAFVSNAYAGNLQIVDTQNDTTAFTAQSTNSEGQVVPGVPVTITVSTSATFEQVSSDRSKTLVYDPSSDSIYFITNSTETVGGDVALGYSTQMALFSTDGNSIYVPIPSLNITGAPRLGGVEVIDDTNFNVTAAYYIPSARYVAVSPTGQYLLVFANNSDSVFLLNLTASTVTPIEIPGFAAPVNAFFTSDGNTAYVLNCGPECGSTGPASVTQLNIPTQTLGATVTVGGASVGLLNGSTLYVAGSPVPPGTTSTYDAVNVSNMTRLTANSVAIGDGFHTTMALASNNKLYIGASTCSNTVTGCLSVVDVSSNIAAAPLPPRGAITSLLAVSGRDVVYAVEGGYLNIYNTTTNTLQGTQLTFTGALYAIVQVDQ